jgi:malic enzyme
MVQFEDFSSDVAMDILNRYRNHHLVFNDDIQGTGAVAVAGIFSALRQQGKDHTALAEQRFVIAGAGSAGLGCVKRTRFRRPLSCSMACICERERARSHTHTHTRARTHTHTHTHLTTVLHLHYPCPVPAALREQCRERSARSNGPGRMGSSRCRREVLDL